MIVCCIHPLAKLTANNCVCTHYYQLLNHYYNLANCLKYDILSFPLQKTYSITMIFAIFQILFHNGYVYTYLIQNSPAVKNGVATKRPQ